MLVFFTIAMLVVLAWLAVNWFLSLASMFVVVQGEDTFGAIAAAAGLCRERTGPVLAVSFWFGLAHGVAFFMATSAVAFPLAFIAILPGSVVLGGVFLVTLLYFAVVDFLYMGRLAAYLYIAENPEDVAIPEIIPPSPPLPFSDGRVDPDEPILSDLPSLAET